MKSSNYFKTYLAILLLLSACFLVELTPLGSRISKGVIIGLVESIMSTLAAFSAFSLYKRQKTDSGPLFIAAGFLFFAFADFYWAYLFYVIDLPREHWISVSLTQFPYALGYSCMSLALFTALDQVRKQREAKKIWLIAAMVLLPFFLRFIAYPTLQKWIHEPSSYFLIGHTFNSLACSVMLYFAIVAAVCARDIFWGLFATGLSALVIENWSFRAEAMMSSTPSYGFYDYIWAFGIGTATIPILMSIFKKANYQLVDSYEVQSLVSTIKSYLILGLLLCLAFFTIFASPEHYYLRFITVGSLLVLSGSLFSSQLLVDKIEEYALMLSIEVAEGLEGDPSKSKRKALPVELKTLFKISLQDRIVQRLKQDEERSNFSSMAAQVAHDLKSPLAALQMIVPDLKTASEEHRMIVIGAMNRIKDICNQILISNNRVNAKDGVTGDRLEGSLVQGLPLVVLIDEIVSEKRVQFRSKLGVLLNFVMSEGSGLYFVALEKSLLQRMISNLINNSIEAVGHTGTVSISLSHDTNFILILIEDNGIGVSKDNLSRIMQKGISINKVGGSGLGLTYAKEMCESVGGSLFIESTEGLGTKVIAKLPLAPSPEWFAVNIELKAYKTVVVLDDDQSIHHLWDKRLKSYKDMGFIDDIWHFSSCQDLEKVLFSMDLDQIEKLCFLVDYEFVGEVESGLQFIKRMQISKQAYLITSRYDDKKLIDNCISLGVPVLPKSLAGYISIVPRSKVYSAAWDTTADQLQLS